MPDTAARRPRLYIIPPSAPFLTTLARAVLNGDLPAPGGAKLDPLTLPGAGRSPLSMALASVERNGAEGGMV